MKYTLIIGLEVHIELSTKNKMFCNCPTEHFRKEPNSQTCPVCLGMPGTLPVPNKAALESTVLISKALNCTINNEFIFARKHYFYPDLPKGYQITQFQNPVGSNGSIEVKGKTFRINRVHIEEDTGKLSHEKEGSLVDLNRAGVPLVEIVTEPDFGNWEDAIAYLKELQLIVRTLGIADADMEKGQMRLEPNISLTHIPGELPDYKVEIKNINSFRYVKKAILFEIERQTKLLDEGIIPPQETRGYDPSRGVTFSQRLKETATQYRYFPEPDIPPIVFRKDEIEKILERMTELPNARKKRFGKAYGIKSSFSEVLVNDVGLADYFEKVVQYFAKNDEELFQQAANFIVNKKVSLELAPKSFSEKVVESLEEEMIDYDLLRGIIAEIISENDDVVSQYRSGKTSAINFLIGRTMLKGKGEFSARVAKDELEKELKFV